MYIEIDKHSGVPIFRQVIDQVKQHILTGQLSEGAQLPSVRDLSEQLKVNPMTISKAYSFLEVEGYAERHRGVGLFVAKGGTETSRRAKLQILEQAFHPVAMQAVQMGVTEDDAVQMLCKLYKGFLKRKGGQGHE